MMNDCSCYGGHGLVQFGTLITLCSAESKVFCHAKYSCSPLPAGIVLIYMLEFLNNEDRETAYEICQVSSTA
jgi:hypothetical protein